MMEVILNKDVERVGRAGSVIKVKDGFARNFLIPNGLAVLLTPQNLKKIEDQKQKKQAGFEALKKEAEAQKARLASLSLTIPVLTQDDKLYGSITAQDVSAALKEEGFDVDKGLILLEPIKSLGIYEATLNLHPEVSAKLKIWIVKK